MSDTDKKPDQEKGDEILRRMLNTPPQPKEKDDKKLPPKSDKES